MPTGSAQATLAASAAGVGTGEPVLPAHLSIAVLGRGVESSSEACGDAPRQWQPNKCARVSVAASQARASSSAPSTCGPPKSGKRPTGPPRRSAENERAEPVGYLARIDRLAGRGFRYQQRW